MAFITLSLLNGLSYGLLLFLLSAGLTLIWGMMGVLNFAHASFYMLGAYLAYSVSAWLGFWPALLLAPLGVGLLGAAFERLGLRRVRRFGHMSELLITFGLSYIVVEIVQLVWGRSSVDYRVPAELDGPLLTVFDTQFPLYRAFIMAVTLGVLGALALLVRTRAGLVIRAALTHPDMAQALGHNVPRVFTSVFGAGCALAGLAGVLGGNAFVTEPGMAQALGGVVFVVVVVGGLGSLKGAFAASLLIGLLQTLAVALDVRAAPVLPYAVMVLMLIFRPHGLAGGAARTSAW
ncbi:branched-chain amino acid ABC transporter permease [Rhodoferax sp. U2-2l]|uniref:branched-chain amino acid ABC transporter permease n=1 Tax=Rhodoferax sp. U2-2l TaxID=2884000 RepID=UPI001D0B08B4|nr:branched-chain amino acid ABC transporter permease [Rhodoferax sp. U2-2l]MCB8745545.1 branched-chain amino acid ABC transporter permease [Rhodoferax sp. U2-2l]